MTPRVLSGRIWSRRRLVHRIGPTGTANPTDRGQALLKCCESAIRGAEMRSIICTPRIVLRLSGCLSTDHCREKSQEKYRKPHGKFLLGFSLRTPIIHALFPALCDEAQRIAANIAKLVSANGAARSPQGLGACDRAAKAAAVCAAHADR